MLTFPCNWRRAWLHVNLWNPQIYQTGWIARTKCSWFFLLPFWLLRSSENCEFFLGLFCSLSVLFRILGRECFVVVGYFIPFWREQLILIIIFTNLFHRSNWEIITWAIPTGHSQYHDLYTVKFSPYKRIIIRLNLLFTRTKGPLPPSRPDGKKEEEKFMNNFS